MPTTWSVPPRVLADAVDLRELVRLGQVNDALAGKADAGHTHGLPAHAATHATGGGDALTAGDIGAVPTSQRGPVGGVNAQTLSANTYNLDASTFNVRRYTLTGDITLNVPTNGADGQRITFWFGASGAQRTVTFASGYEVSPLLPSRVIVIASGTWEMVEVECRGGTWRLVQTDQLLFPPSAIGASGAASVTQLRATASQTCSVAGTWYSVAFAAEDFDDENCHDNTTNNTRWTAPRACVVKVGASIVWVGSQSTTNPQRLVQLTRSGTIVPGSPGNQNYVATGLTQTIQPMLVSMTAGQYLELQMRSAAAGAQIYADSSTCSIMTIEVIR